MRTRSRFLSLSCGLAATLAVACGDDGSADGDESESSGDSTSADSTSADPSGPDDSTSDDPDGSDTTAADTGGSTDDAGSESSETGQAVCEVTPGAWAAPDWDANTVDALAVRAALDALTGDPLMRGAETGAVVLGGLEDLTAAWDGTPSLADAASPGFAAIVDQSFVEFVDIIAAGEQDLIDAGGAWSPGPAGGVWGDSDRGINEGGLEARQLVDKGAFGGLLYAYAVGLTEGEIDEATIDAIAAVWGNNATLDPEDAKVPLTDAANYAFQMGFHADMAAALTAAKAYAPDAACTAERDAALVTFFNLWEQTMYARLVFYGNRAAGKLLAATTDTEFADVLHDLGEGIGVAIGFHGMPNPASGPLSAGVRIISDADVEAAMGSLGVDLGALGASTTGFFVESLLDLETGVEGVEGVVMDVYGVDAATIQTYRMPTPG
jgi:hypothetical protein